MPCVGHKSWCKVSGLSHSEELKDRGGFILKLLSQKESLSALQSFEQAELSNFEFQSFRLIGVEEEGLLPILEPCISPMTLLSRVGIASKV